VHLKDEGLAELPIRRGRRRQGGQQLLRAGGVSLCW